MEVYEQIFFLNEEFVLENVAGEAKMCSSKWPKLKSNMISNDIFQWYMNLRACIGIMDT